MSNRRRVATDLLGAVAVFALSCCVFIGTGNTIRHEPAWRTFEFCQYAEIGRNMAGGQGYVTGLIEPMALAFLDAHHRGEPGPPWPVIDRFPLPCLVIAGLMRLMGASDWAAAWSNGLAISLLAALTYLIALRSYGFAWSCVAVLLFLSNPSFYGYFVLLGTPDIWFAFWFLLQMLVWVRLLERADFSPGWSLLLGVLTGVCYLARFNMVVFAAVQVAILLWRRRFKDAGCTAVASLIVVAPILIRNWFEFGRVTVSIYSTWNLLDRVGAFPVEPWLYYRLPDVTAFLADHAAGILRKFATNLFVVIPSRIWTLWHFYLLIPLASLAWWSRAASPRARSLLGWSCVLFAWQLIVFSGLRLEFEHRLSPHHGRYFFWFAVPLLLAALGVLRRWFLDRGRLVRLVVVFLVLAQFGFFAATWVRWTMANREPIYLGRDPIRSWLAREIPRDRLVASNQPQLLLWYSGLSAISLPADPIELRKVNDASRTPVEYIFIDLNYNSIELDGRWAELVRPAAAMAAEHSSWEPIVLRDYEYVRPPSETRPFLFVLLRRR